MKNSAFRWLREVTGKKKIIIAVLTIIQAVNSCLGVSSAILLKGLVDGAVAKSFASFRLYLTLLVILIILQQTLRAFLRYMNELCKADLENLFKKRMMENLLKKNFAGVSAVHTGVWMNRLTNDSVVCAEGCTEILPGFIGLAVKIAGVLIMILVLDRRFAFILIPGGLALVFFSLAFRKKMKKLHKDVQEKDGAFRMALQDDLTALMVVHSFAAEKRTSELLDEKMEGHKRSRMIRNRFSNICNTGFGSVMSSVFVFAAAYCAYGILTGTISYGTMTAVTQLVTQLQTPLANISGYIPRYYSMLASAERLMEIEAFSDDGSEIPMESPAVSRFYDESFSEIIMDSVSYTYYRMSESGKEPDKDKMPEVLDGLSLNIKKGTYTAFTGASGGGKSTVIKLLMGLYQPDEGEVCIIDKENRKTKMSSAWRRLFAYVPQGNYLMSGTIRDVVAFADPDRAYDTERIEQALRISCAYDFVKGLDNGSDTLLGERGSGLSEGQMQRLAIARAVFSESPVLILDEATSALDESTEKILLENLRSMTDKTVIIVTHRPAALSICDQVLRIGPGGVTESYD